MSEERQPIPGPRDEREEGGDKVPGRDGEGGYENIAMTDSPTDPTSVSLEGITVGSSPPEVQFQSANEPSSPTDLNANRSDQLAPPGSPRENEDRSSEQMASVLGLNYPDDDGDDNVDGDERSLMYKRYEPIRSKDFVAEVRAYMDVEQFINQAQLILDIPDTNLAAIIDHMLAFMVHKGNASWTVKEAKQELFTHDSVQQLRRTIQGAMRTEDCGFDYDQHWVCVMCTLATAQTRSVSIARLKSPANLSRTLQEARFIVLIVAPAKEKSTKNALETARTFATLFNDMELRSRLQAAHSMESFKKYMLDHAKKLTSDESPDGPNRKASTITLPVQPGKSKSWFARNLREDFWRRFHCYASDFKDGLMGPGTVYKTLSTIVFLYFAILLPSIALGELNSTNTDGAIDVKKVIYTQFIGGLYFAVFGGQPMIILLTTAPLALYTKVVFNIADSMDVDFLAMYACTGLWNMLFLFIYAFSGASVIMKWSTRSTEEIFALFISIAFTADACKGVYKQFQETYHTGCEELAINGTSVAESCEREKSILYLLLVLGTVWLGLTLFNFTKTPFLNAGKRELLADFALPVSVVVLSFFGSFVFSEINLTKFKYEDKAVFVPGSLGNLTLVTVFTSMGLGFCLSLLFFMDQNISGAMVNSPENRLKKGTAYHWDLFVVGLLNGALTFMGLPMIHGALPHSPLHVLAMADVEDRVEGGVIKQKVVFVRENRVTGIIVHILVGLSLLMLPSPLFYIPPAVLDGLFLYLAITALNNNQMFERLTLLFTEQAQYPPNHYISRVPQRKIHFFTVLQLLQLLVLCGIGFAPMPFLKMVFPVLIFLMLPIRHKIIPLLIDRKYLNFIDSNH